MKKIILPLLFLCSHFYSIAQDIDKAAAMRLVENNKNATGLTSSTIQNSIVSAAYYNKTAGTEMVYLQQGYKGLPVYNQLLTLAFKNGQLVSKSGSFIQSIDKKTAGAAEIPTQTAADAVRAVLAEKKLISSSEVVSYSASSAKKHFGKLGVASEDITAELIWVPLNEGKSVKLAWQIYLVPANSSDYWMVRVDANNNRILEESNLTVYCYWGEGEATHKAHSKTTASSVAAKNYFSWNGSSPLLVSNASYRVVPYPAESPNHTGGTPALVNNPWTLAGGNAVSLGWHNDGTTDYTITRGNNVWAKEDRDGNNNTIGVSAFSTTTPDPLTFDFTPNFTIAPTQTTPVQNQQFNISNVFYWNNIIHDLTYNYGFDEVAGNFQANNQGRGGAGNDYVNADAQDGSGTNNANFATPADGSSGRMQMYLWNGSPQKDGDVDNGVVVHEYGHGVSNRLTGGPAQAGCLQNVEQMGEGWSDYLSLMATQDWASSTLTDGATKPRGIGTYVVGQTVTGPGIRQFRYCTDMAVNPLTYTSINTAAIPHGIGTVWCTVLWDMTWNIIQQVGSINPNLFNAAGTGGNSIAFKLVMEGMKLQPCSPGFIDGRDAILQADQLLYNGQYHCAILQAFARRGMGADARQGSSNSRSDQVVGFSTVESALRLSQNVTQQEENQNIIYTNRVTAGPCGDITNFLLTDTLPTNVTYVSGGSYNSSTRVVSFPVNVVAGTSQNYSFTVRVNAGSYFPTVNLYEDVVPANSIPAGWAATSSTTTNWVTSGATTHSAPFAYYSANLDVISDQRLSMTNSISLGATPPPFTFWNWYNTESTYDGGVLEISTDGGTTWADVGQSNFIIGGYSGTMDGSTALAGRPAWTGNSSGYVKSSVNLTPWANQSARFRFRFSSDLGTSLFGWNVDDITIKKQALVEIKSSLFNPTGNRLATNDTFTIILPEPAGCVNVSVANQPTSVSGCTGNSVTISADIAGTNPSYQWQESTTGCAGTFTNIAGATQPTLTLSGLTAAQNNNVYRVVATNACPSNITSACITLTVNETAVISTQPTSTAICEGLTANFSSNASVAGMSYQWQLSTDNGSSWADIAGANTANLSLSSVTASMNGNQYRVRISGPCTDLTSNAATLSVNLPVSITSQPLAASACNGDIKQFSVQASGLSITYQWQLSTDGGNTWTDITNNSTYNGSSTNTLTVIGVSQALNGNRYRAIVSGIPCGTVNSAGASLTVNANPDLSLTASATALNPYTKAIVTATATPAGNYMYDWYKNNLLIPGITGSTYEAGIDDVGDLKVIARNQATGCADTSAAIKITGIQSDIVFISPNPNDGIFTVRFYKDPVSGPQERYLSIYDSKGARVYVRKYSITAIYEKMQVTLPQLASGVYMVELTSSSGKRLGVGKAVVQ